jgi:hypothetical protein
MCWLFDVVKAIRKTEYRASWQLPSMLQVTNTMTSFWIPILSLYLVGATPTRYSLDDIDISYPPIDLHRRLCLYRYGFSNRPKKDSITPRFMHESSPSINLSDAASQMPLDAASVLFSTLPPSPASAHKLQCLSFISLPTQTTTIHLTYRHDHTRNAHIRTQALSDARSLPKRRDEVVLLVAVDYAGEDVVRVGGCADCEEDYEEEGLEVEEGGLGGLVVSDECRAGWRVCTMVAI